MLELYIIQLLSSIKVLCGILGIIGVFVCFVASCGTGDFKLFPFVAGMVLCIICIVIPSKNDIILMHLIPVMEKQDTIDNVPDYVLEYIQDDINSRKEKKK